jgi:hypothetical protein
MSATAGVPTLPAFTADSVRAAGSSPSAVHRPILPMSLQCTASPTDVSTGRPLASHLTSDGDSRRREIRLGKRPVQEVPAAIVTGNFLFLFSLAFSFPFLCNIIFYALVM